LIRFETVSLPGSDPPLDAGFDPRNHRRMHAFSASDVDPLNPLQQEIPDAEFAIPNLGRVLRIDRHETSRVRLTVLV